MDHRASDRCLEPALWRHCGRSPSVGRGFLILLTGTDETFSQTVHGRSSYKADEVTFEARFKNIFDHGADGALSIDISAIHEVEPAA